jgi:hypothetical protein
MKRFALIVVALMLSGCAAQTVGTVSPAGTPGEAGTVGEVASVAPANAQPTPTGPPTYKPGDTITVQQEGKDWAKITISDVNIAASYKSGGNTDTPKVAGDVYISANVTYEALDDGVTYTSYDWQVFCAGTAMDTYAMVFYGPKPQLSSGTLPKGQKASGYVVYELPAKGEVRMSYGGQHGGSVTFEVVIRHA